TLKSTPLKPPNPLFTLFGCQVSGPLVQYAVNASRWRYPPFMAIKNVKTTNQIIEPKMTKEGKLTLGVGVGALMAGFMFLAIGSMTLAPILIIGGLITIGVGLYNL